MTARDFAIQVVRQLQQAGYTALWAGGCVRDLLMRHPPADYDVATNARPDEIRTLFGTKKTLAVGEQFGVIIVIGPKSAGNVEVATFRSDGSYSDGRRPDHVLFSSPQEDASRRDFTINGMFLDPLTETLHDYVGGEADLKIRQIRAIGDAHQRIQEDKLRMLRAIRFATRFGFDLEASTSAAVRNDAPQIHLVSVERIMQELHKMFEHPARAEAYMQLVSHGLWQQLFPTLPGHPVQYQRTIECLRQIQTSDWRLALWLALEPETESSPLKSDDDLGKRWRLSNEDSSTLHWLTANRHSLDRCAENQFSLAHLKTILAHQDSDLLIEAMRGIAVVDNNQQLKHDVQFAVRFKQQTPAEQLAPPPLLTGKDLINAGLKPGPQFKELLGTAYEHQLNEQLNDRESAFTWMKAQIDRLQH